MSDNTLLRGIEFGLVGGLAGTVLMDLVMMATFIAVGAKPSLFFEMVGERLGDGATLGIAVHNLIGMTGGLVFSILVTRVNVLELTSMRKGVMLGAAAGAITIPLGCVPLAFWLGEPVIDVIAFSALPHLVWGTVLGWTVSHGLARPSAQF